MALKYSISLTRKRREHLGLCIIILNFYNLYEITILKEVLAKRNIRQIANITTWSLCPKLWINASKYVNSGFSSSTVSYTVYTLFSPCSFYLSYCCAVHQRDFCILSSQMGGQKTRNTMQKKTTTTKKNASSKTKKIRGCLEFQHIDIPGIRHGLAKNLPFKFQRGQTLLWNHRVATINDTFHN